MQRCAVKCLNRAAPAPPQPRPSPHPALAPHPSRRSALLRRHARLSPARPARTRAPGASWTLRCAGTESGSTLGTGERPRHAFPAAAPWRGVDRNHGPPAPTSAGSPAPAPPRRISRHRPRSKYRGREREATRIPTETGPRFKTHQTRYQMGYVRVKWDMSESNGIRPSQMGYPVRVIWDIPSESNGIPRPSQADA